jgi:hypothetical protein
MFAKVDRDVALVAMAMHVYFLVYIPNVSSVSDVCCKCFHLYVTKIDLDVAYKCMLQVYLSSILDVNVCCKCFGTLIFMQV